MSDERKRIHVITGRIAAKNSLVLYIDSRYLPLSLTQNLDQARPFRSQDGTNTRVRLSGRIPTPNDYSARPMLRAPTRYTIYTFMLANRLILADYGV